MYRFTDWQVYLPAPWHNIPLGHIQSSTEPTSSLSNSCNARVSFCVFFLLFLLVYVLATSKVIWGWVSTYYRAHSCDFIVLSHWETRPPAAWSDIPLNHIILTLSQPVLVIFFKMLSARLGSDKCQFSSHWFDPTRVWTHKVWITRSPKMGDGCFTHSAIPSSPSEC